MDYVRISPAPSAGAYLVVALDDLKRQVRIDGDDEDEALEALLRAAIASVDSPASLYRECFVPGTFQALARGPAGCGGFEISLHPVRDVESVECLVSGSYVPVTGWTVERRLGTDPAVIVRPPPGGWPAAEAHPQAWRIAVDVGHEVLPPPVRVAILMRAAYLFGNRGESNPGGEPPTIAALLAPYRRMSV